MTTWHDKLLARLASSSLMSPSQLARAVEANGGQVSRQVAWKWMNGGLSAPGNLIPICRSVGLIPNSNEESIFIRSWAEAQHEQMRDNEDSRNSDG